MENMNFLSGVLTFLVLICFSLLSLNIKNIGKYIAYSGNLIATATLLLFINGHQKLQLTDLFYIEGTSLNFLMMVGIFTMLIGLINGSNTTKDVKNSILASFMYFASIFLVGSSEFITFYVAFEMISLLGLALVATSSMKFSKEAAVKYFIQSSVISSVFLLGIAFFYGATGSLNFTDYVVVNQQLFAIAVLLLFITAAFKLGAFPFHAWVPDVYSNVDKGNMATNFLITKLVIGYVMITMLQMLLADCEPDIQSHLITAILTVSVISAFYGNMMGLVQKQFKRIISYSSVAHAGYMLMTITLNPDENYQSQLVFYLTFYSIAATGVLLMINEFLGEGKQEDIYESLKGGFYKNAFLGLSLTVFSLSLAGIPLTAGFSTKYLLFTNYFREGLAPVAIAILLSSVIGLGYYIKFPIVLFMENNNSKSSVVVSTSMKTRLIQLFLLVAILAGGIFPSLFLKY